MPDVIVEPKAQPPKLIPSLVEGFNAIAGHVYVIFLPVLFDLLLWFGPLLRVRDLLLPAILDATELSAAAYGQEAQQFLNSRKELWTVMLEQFNIFFGLRTYPVGVPSLLISMGVLENPLGTAHVLELQSSGQALWLILALSLAGVLLGSFYFALVAGVVSQTTKPMRLGVLLRQTMQILILSITLIIALFLLSIPALCLTSSMVLLIPSLGSLPLFLFGLVLVWVLLPMAFSPHGIIVDQLKASAAIANSFRLVRSLMSLTGLFFIMLILLGYGLDFLWSTPAPNNWMLLIGILGHAFISSGLIAASFVYYQKGMHWLSRIIPPAPVAQPENSK